MAISPARKFAYDILDQVSRGGHSTDLLWERTEGLSSRDAGLCGEIVLGVLRWQAQLDFLAGHFAKRDPAQLDPELVLALRIGIYQLRYLDRIPRHAAVSESVELVKRARKRSGAGLVNAVLRRVNRDPVEWPSRQVALSHPEWLLARWEKHYGAGAAKRIAEAFLRPPEAYIRVPAGREAEAAELDSEMTALPGCYRLRSGGPGPFRRQDIGSQSIVPLLDLQPGQRLLDLCCAPGNKTAQALESGARIVGGDISLQRLRPVALPGVDLVNLDGRHRLPFREPFERILIDAPCSGTGTIGRNPEIKWRLQPADLERQQRRQLRLARNAAAALAPGGRLVYSTCSLEPEENEEVVRQVLGAADCLALERELQRLPGSGPGDGFYAAVIVARG